MVAGNGKVSVDYELLEQILSAKLTITTTRLLIGMIHMQDLQELWSSDDRFIVAPEDAGMWAFGAELRQLVGPAKVNKAAPLKSLISEVSEAQLFDKIELTDKNCRLRWCFSGHVHEKMRTRWFQNKFALLDVPHVAQCRTHLKLALYCQVRSLRNHPIPEFTIPLDVRWCDYRRELFRSLQQVSAMIGTTFFVGLEWLRRGEAKQQVRVRLRHPGTTWYPDKLRSWSSDAKVYRISASESSQISALQDYAILGEDPESVEINLRKNLS